MLSLNLCGGGEEMMGWKGEEEGKGGWGQGREKGWEEGREERGKGRKVNG